MANFHAHPRVRIPRRALSQARGRDCSRTIPKVGPTVFDRLPNLRRAADCRCRLDFNTSGTLLFVNDGDLANKLMHPDTN